MVRRRRAPRTSSGVQLIQILGLVLVLVMIIMFRDQIGDGAGALFGSFDSEDVRLPEENKPTSADVGAHIESSRYD